MVTLVDRIASSRSIRAVRLVSRPRHLCSEVYDGPLRTTDTEQVDNLVGGLVMNF